MYVSYAFLGVGGHTELNPGACLASHFTFCTQMAGHNNSYVYRSIHKLQEFIILFRPINKGIRMYVDTHL